MSMGAEVPETSQNDADADRAELAKLRQERADREAQEAAARQAEEDARPDPSHWLTLGNGDVVKSAGTATHVDGVPVVASTPIPADYEEVSK